MDKTQIFIDSFLEHETKYYDPVKAHEYYLRTRELKGRPRSGLKTEAKRQAWDYAKSEIKEAKNAEIGAASEAKTPEIEQARQVAEKRRSEIRDKLSVLLERISNKTADEVSRKIDALPPIPRGISKDRAKKLRAQRSEEIARIRGEAREEKQGVREAAGSEREQVRAGLKQSIETARTNYQTLKESLKAKYETEAQQEYEAIVENV